MNQSPNIAEHPTHIGASPTENRTVARFEERSHNATSEEMTALNQSLIESAHKGDLAGVLKALEGGAEINAFNEHGVCALSFAALHDDATMFNLLITRGATVDLVNYLGFTPFLMASYYGYVSAVQRLINAGADVNKRRPFGITALQAACHSGIENDPLVDILLKAGADVNVSDDYGTTPFMNALASGNVSVIAMLLAKL